MSPLIAFGRWYLETGIAFAVGFILFKLITRLGKTSWLQVSQASWLHLARLIWIAAVVFPMMMSQWREDRLPRPAIQLAPSQQRAANPTLWRLERNLPNQVSIQIPQGYYADFPLYLGLFAGGNALIGFFIFYRRRKSLQAYLLSLPILKSHRNIRLCFSNNEHVAFSTRLSNVIYLVFPHSYLIERNNLMLALKHESQHHRQKDTLWVWLVEIASQCYLWSPFTRFWNAEFENLQELACDEALIVRQQVSPLAYGRCLLRAAEMAVESRAMLAGTTSMARTTQGLQLKRRIEMLLAHRTHKKKTMQWVLIYSGALGMLATSSYAIRAAVGAKALSMREAKSLFSHDLQGAEIPLNLNDLVLDRLNHYIGTEKGKAYMRSALTRMPQYQEMIETKIEEYGMPQDLIGVPLWESGFDNSVVSSGYHSRGIWQFIAQTARRYGLTVTDQLDERIVPLKETDAAMRYLRDLFDRFQDWRLALKAYNEGEERVDRLIKKYKTRDAWKLEHLDSSENYLSGVTAMMLLLKHPELYQ